MSVRAKFKVTAVEWTMGSKATGEKKDGRDVYAPCKMATIKMSPTYSSEPNSENKKFWDASPGGQLTLNCVNAAAVEQLELDGEFYVEQLELDGEFYVDFTPAPKG